MKKLIKIIVILICLSALGYIIYAVNSNITIKGDFESIYIAAGDTSLVIEDATQIEAILNEINTLNYKKISNEAAGKIILNGDAEALSSVTFITKSGPEYSAVWIDEFFFISYKNHMYEAKDAYGDTYERINDMLMEMLK